MPHTRLVPLSWLDGTVRYARFPGGCGCSESDGGGSICRAHGGLDTGGHELEDSAQWYPRCLTTLLRLDPLHALRVFDCIVSPVATGVFVGEVHSLDVSCFLVLSLHRFTWDVAVPSHTCIAFAAEYRGFIAGLHQR